MSTHEPRALEQFHPVVRRWFASSLGAPTTVQRLAWPRIAGGEHVLAVAPTGSGKTLAAFLWAIDRLMAGAWPPGQVRVLYVSPLKALGSDVQRNLLGPLDELRAAFAAEGQKAPVLRALVRSGDTPQEDRRRMARFPPEILVTTPESLNILLTSRRGRDLLRGLRTVILDEVHSVIGGKRGAQLITAVERLVPLAGEIQRIALSATVRPVERVAGWLGGFSSAGRRPVAVVLSRDQKRYEIEVESPNDEAELDLAAGAGPWPNLVESIRSSMSSNRTTLVFANSRRVVEKLTRLVNERDPDVPVFAHHGSLSLEVRRAVEKNLKDGKLSGVVATNSLELGIDIGALDEVILVQSPPSIASAAQRIGRAGHSVGAVSRARFLSLVPRDLLDAAIIAPAVLAGEIEPISPVMGALDVLAQIVVSCVATEEWKLDDLFALVRRTEPYRDLPRRQFDLVLAMLAGASALRRGRAPQPLIYVDRLAGTARGLPGAERRVYLAGGTIPDRGMFHLRLEGSGALLGELDEEFVWERSVGDAFTLGVQAWRIERITHNDVFVTTSGRRAAMAPFWRADERYRPFALMERIALFLESVEPRLRDASLIEELVEKNRLVPKAAAALIRFLKEQAATAGGKLPHRRRLIAERVLINNDEQLVLHTLWGGRVNLPFSLALAEAWERRHGSEIDVMCTDDCVVVNDASAIEVSELIALLTGSDVEGLLRARLPRAGVFGARFREAAAITLLLPREGFRRRTPLWLSRQRSKELMQSVADIGDYPITLEAWRSCMQDVCDVESLKRVLGEIESGLIDVSEADTASPSPFSAFAQWKRTNDLMYADDTPPPGASPRASDELLGEIAFSSRLRPRLARRVCAELEGKLKRNHLGYAPRSTDEILSFLEERVLVPLEEWRDLLAAVDRDRGPETIAHDRVDEHVVAVRLSERKAAGFVAPLSTMPRIVRALEIDMRRVELKSAISGLPVDFDPDALLSGEEADAFESVDSVAELIADVLRFYGPVAERFIPELLALAAPGWSAALRELADAQRIVIDALMEGSEERQICDAVNLERLLRLTRAAARPTLTPLPLARLPFFLATWQGLPNPATGVDGVRAALDRLNGYPAPAGSWEQDLLPARVADYQPAWLDALFSQGGTLWLGCGDERLTLVTRDDIDLVSDGGNEESTVDLEKLFPVAVGRFTFEELLAHSHIDSADLTRLLWDLAWRGEITSDGYDVVRRGIASRFKPSDLAASSKPNHGAGRRRRFALYARTRSFGGAWLRLPSAESPSNPLDEEDLARDRVRALLRRYGILFRELLGRELPALSWGRLFRSLRLMELSGEIVAGRFVEGVDGLQFASTAAVQLLRDGLDLNGTYALNGIDPASPCGMDLPWSKAWPRRVPSTHIVLSGPEAVIVVENGGRKLDISVEPADARLESCLEILRTRLARGGRSSKSIAVETINGQAAAQSSYRPAFERFFDVTRYHHELRLMKRF